MEMGRTIIGSCVEVWQMRKSICRMLTPTARRLDCWIVYMHETIAIQSCNLDLFNPYQIMVFTYRFQEYRFIALIRVESNFKRAF